MRLAPALVAAALLTACQAQPPVDGQLVASTHTDELERAAAKLLGLQSVRLAIDAFQQRPIISLMPSAARTPKGVLATGTTIGRPEQLRLVRYTRTRCALVRIKDEGEVRLSRGLCADVVAASQAED